MPSSNLHPLWARFVDKKREAAFRAYALSYETRWALWSLSAGALFFVGFILVDLQDLTWASGALGLDLSIRLTVAGIGVLLAWYITHPASPRRLDWGIHLAEVALLLGFLGIVYLRPHGLFLNGISALVVLMAILLLAPGCFVISVLIAFTGAIAFMIEAVVFKGASPHEMLHMAMAFLLLLSYGVVTLHGRHTDRRRNYGALQQAEEAREELREEVVRRMAAQGELEASEANFRALFEGAPVPLLLTAASDGQVLEINQAFVDLAQRDRLEILAAKTERFYLDAKDRVAFMKTLENQGGRVRGYELQLTSHPGRILTVLAAVDPLTWHGIPARLISLTDISERKVVEDELRIHATLDPLTSLPNRRLFDERVFEEMARARRYGRSLLMALIDVDHFKRVNDLLGHRQGDDVLRHVGAYCAESMREGDFIARIGGDEFVVLIPETELEAGVRLLERIQSGLAATSVQIEGREVFATVSIGVTPFDPGEGLEETLARADRALYRAKSQGRNRVESEGGAPLRAISAEARSAG